MEDINTGSVTAFDSLYTNGKIQMLKVILSRFPPHIQTRFAVFIKFMELRYTLSLLYRSESRPLSDSLSCGHPLSDDIFAADIFTADIFTADISGISELLEELLPYGSAEERQRIAQMKSMLQNYAQMKEMLDMIEMLKEIMPENFEKKEGAENSGLNLSDLLNLFQGKED